jgi:hypothetical protein
MRIPKPGADFKPAPAGNWPAVCFRIIDLGTQKTTYKGVEGKAHQVLISWELHDDETKGDDVKPMIVQRAYTWSMSPKANLRKTLESWRGAPFTEADFGVFDISKLLGAGCLINLTHSESNGTTYANITSVSKLPKGMSVGKPVNEMICLGLTEDTFDRAVFDKLSEKLQAKISETDEYQEVANGGYRGDVGGVEDDDEIPF